MSNLTARYSYKRNVHHIIAHRQLEGFIIRLTNN